MKGCQRLVQEFFIPCKILLSNTTQVRSPNQEHKKLRLYRAPSAAPGTGNSSLSASVAAAAGGGGSSGGETTSGSPTMSPSAALPDGGEIFPRPQALQLHTLQEEVLGLSMGSSPRSGYMGNGDIRANRSTHRTSGSGTGGGSSVSGGVEGQSTTVDTTVPGSVETAGNGAAPGSKQALRVLIIEDTIPVQKLLARWLHNHGCAVTCANNGKIGLDHLQSGAFDITFVDFLMVSLCASVLGEEEKN